MYNGIKNNKAEPKCGENLIQNCKEDKITNKNGSDLFIKYLHDIRNMKTLDKEMIKNIRNMSNEEKMYIILSFNDVVENLKSFIE